MKKQVMTAFAVAASFLGMAVAPSAIAGYELTVAECGPEHPIPDYGYSVKVARSVKGIPGMGFKKVYKAYVTTRTIAGPRPFGAFKVNYKPADPNRLGSSPSFKGEGFELNYFTDGRPRADGRFPAIMEARSEHGNDVSEKLLCTLTMF